MTGTASHQSAARHGGRRIQRFIQAVLARASASIAAPQTAAAGTNQNASAANGANSTAIINPTAPTNRHTRHRASEA